jgi:hypothetical protein
MTSPVNRPKWVIQRDDEAVTWCEEPHPVRLGRNAQHVRNESWERNIAIRDGRKGYLCGGNEEHFYTCWVVFDEANPGRDNKDVFDVYKQAVEARDRFNQEEQATWDQVHA